jgi:hypothetical protein
VSQYTGGGACGNIRYESSAEPQLSLHCCCRACQRASGGGCTSLFIAPAKSLRVMDDLRFFDRTAESGNTVRGGFCPTCGSPVTSVNSGYPDVRYIHAATLDDPWRFVPERVVWGSERQPWDHLDPSLG